MIDPSDQFPEVEFDDLPIYAGQPRYTPALGSARQPHLHHHYEIFWLSAGPAKFFHEFKYYDVPAGTLMFVAPGQVHHFWGEDHPYQLTVVGFGPRIFSLGEGDVTQLSMLPFFEPNASPVLNLTEPQQEVLAPLLELTFRRINPLLDAPLTERPHSIMLAYLQTLLLEIRAAYVARYPVPELTAGTLLTQQYRRAVEQHYRDRKTVNDYAQLLGVTANHLVRTVRLSTGTPPAQIARERLLLEAKRQLTQAEIPISALAEQLNFHSASQFSRWFRRMAGVAPKQFRQAHSSLLSVS